MVFFVAFLVLTTIILQVVALSQAGQVTLSLVFALMLISGSFATIQHRSVICLVVGLTTATFATDLGATFGSSHSLAVVNTGLRVASLSVLFCVTLKRTLRPGRITRYRVMGGIAGYLLVGLIWTFAYQMLMEGDTDAIHFDDAAADTLPGQPSRLIYFSFTTLTTVGFGDVHPETPAARSLTVAEALVGQLYVAILIASLVGMALQARTMEDGEIQKE